MPWTFDATYPGVLSLESLTYTTSLGISPGVVTFLCHPASDPALRGACLFAAAFDADPARAIALPDCQLTGVSGSASASGRKLSVTLLDRRWKWLQGYPQFLHANQVDAHHKLIPTTVRSPYQLCVMCLTAMGEPTPSGGWEAVLDVPRGLAAAADPALGIPAPASFDEVVDAAKDFLKVGVNFSRSRTNPVTVWTATPAAVALAQLVEQWGCSPCLDPLTDRVSVVRLGKGVGLSAGRQLSYAPAVSLDGVPAAITAQGSPTRYQLRLRFRAVAQEWDGDWVPPEAVSYAPELPGPGQAMIVTGQILGYLAGCVYGIWLNGVRFVITGVPASGSAVVAALASAINASTDPRVAGKVTATTVPAPPFVDDRLKLTGILTPTVGYEFKLRVEDPTLWTLRPLQGPIPSPTPRIHRQTVAVDDPTLTFVAAVSIITVTCGGSFSNTSGEVATTVSVTLDPAFAESVRNWNEAFVDDRATITLGVGGLTFVSLAGDDIPSALRWLCEQFAHADEAAGGTRGRAVFEGYTLTILAGPTDAVTASCTSPAFDMAVPTGVARPLTIPEALAQIAAKINADPTAKLAVVATAMGRILAIDGRTAGTTVAVTASATAGVVTVKELQAATAIARGFHLAGMTGAFLVKSTDRLNYEETRAACEKSINRCYQLVCEDASNPDVRSIPMPVPPAKVGEWKIDFAGAQFQAQSGFLGVVISGATIDTYASYVGLGLVDAVVYVSRLLDAAGVPNRLLGNSLLVTPADRAAVVTAYIRPEPGAGTVMVAKIASKSVPRRQLITLLDTRVEQVLPRGGDTLIIDPRTLSPYAFDTYHGYSADRRPAVFGSISSACFNGLVYPLVGGIGVNTVDAQQIYQPFTVVDEERQVIQFAKPLFRHYGKAGLVDGSGNPTHNVTLPLDPVIEVGCLVADERTLCPYRFSATVAIPGATAPPVTRIFEDVQEEIIGIYDEQHRLVDLRLNDADAQQRASLYAKEAASKYQFPTSQTIGYSGLELISLGGRIRQIEWRFDASGHGTTASENSEFSRVIPGWGDRRRAENMPGDAQRAAENLNSHPFFRTLPANLSKAVASLYKRLSGG